MEQKLLIRGLKPVETRYHQDLRCMEGTHKSSLGKSQTGWPVYQGRCTWEYNLWLTWHRQDVFSSFNLCKPSDKEQLAGAFFCRRDDPNLSEPRNILPTLIHKLALIFSPFRSIVAERLREDPNMTPESMKHTLLLGLILKLSRLPQRSLVFVTGALDECGSTQTRPGILSALTDAAAHAPWLRIIITSSPKSISNAFSIVPPSCRIYDVI